MTQPTSSAGDAHIDRAVAARWQDIPGEFARRGVFRRGFGTDEVLLVMNEISSTIDVAPHKHDDFDQIAYIVSGQATYHVGDVDYDVGPGSLLHIPAGIVHYIAPIGSETVMNLDVFAPLRTDYRHLIDWMRSTR